jgi:2-succinyl-6-hydroxy-2,4-cyclohexadiene-1-carboxylate synthase
MSEAGSAAWRPLGGPLAAEQLGDESKVRMVFVHGFTQTANSWKPIAEHFHRVHGHQVVVVDLPGHGRSAHVRADLRRTADLMSSVAGPGIQVGYSLGGRACLHLALSYPNLVRRLVLIGAHPGIDDDEERAARRTSDDELADDIVDMGVPVFLREWTALPLFGGFTLPEAEFNDRCRNTAEGLATSLRLSGTGTQTGLWARLRELNMPVLTMAGEHDLKFTAIEEQIAATVKEGRFRSIPDAAHAAHLQNPAAVIAAIEEWMDDITSPM